MPLFGKIIPLLIFGLVTAAAISQYAPHIYGLPPPSPFSRSEKVKIRKRGHKKVKGGSEKEKKSAKKQCHRIGGRNDLF